jgi:hypothetical protein
VPGAAHALQPRRDGVRRLHLHHQIDRPHVDAELERRRRHHGWDAPRAQRLLDLRPLLAADRPVVCTRDLFLRQLVQPRAQALGEPAGVGEDDRAPVRADQLQQPFLDVRPDAAALLGARRATAGDAAGRLADRPQVLHRDDDREVERRVPRGSHDRHRLCATEEAGHFLERPHRGREADPLRRGPEQGLEALEAERQVGPALRPRDGVHLVHDDRLDGPQRVARRGRQE